jgi:hypothetical protein
MTIKILMEKLGRIPTMNQVGEIVTVNPPTQKQRWLSKDITIDDYYEVKAGLESEMENLQQLMKGNYDKIFTLQINDDLRESHTHLFNWKGT